MGIFDRPASARPLSPSPSSVNPLARVDLSRRSVLGGALGLSALGLLTACGGTSTTAPATTSGAATGTVSFGSNQSDAVPKAAYQKVVDAFTKANSGLKVNVNTVDHNTFQESINSYLQGAPDDVFTWFSGFRMKFFADQGLAADISSVWESIGGSFNDSFKQAATATDGKQYFVPFTYYPWAVFYRKSVFESKGYKVPTTLTEYVDLAKGMKSDGLTPIGFADKDGWPAMGTFDILNMRLNGYQFHVDLMGGKESWDQDRVKEVFNTWGTLLPYHQSGSLGRTWQEAAQGLQQKKTGTYLLGLFVAQQFQTPGSSSADLDDLDFFTFPKINDENGTDSIDAPIDGFMMSSKAKNANGALEFLKFLGTKDAEKINVQTDKSIVGAAKDFDTSGYTALQKKAVEVVSSAKHIAQFMDRDTRPDFASTVMIPSIQKFIQNPKDINPLVSSIEEQKKAIFAG
ncbi:ABC transporter substrate-binding protein [Tersicoccus sp. Bi-70]|uniref:ABC transporter substrate-binding protein n=1 Tax=Tersicoccus sp. Bi-70 TaxID=1897634 RepID=UPI000978B081|nr:ABC transporter substrate-binding protein [Tersicoccus sp. Bi-70]OMH31428.1 sugar ABC transporter substrate-binding protein [Tersicoccus sp. Bi-70]